jgi:hypothetical protein
MFGQRLLNPAEQRIAAMLAPCAGASFSAGLLTTPAATGANGVDDIRRATAEATAGSGDIPLALAPLLAPYARYKDLSLRVENLAVGARLSRGRNNGDRSWSLTLDDLDGLQYLPAKGAQAAHNLTIRVFRLDDGYAATLAVLDIPVAPGDATPAPAPEVAATPGNAAVPGNDVALHALRDALVAMQATLAERETALAETQQKAAAELIAARTSWKAELEKRLTEAAAQAATNLEQSRTAWQAEQDDRIAKSEQRAQERIDEARANWQQDAKTVLAKARIEWEAELNKRLAEAAAQAATELEQQRAGAQAAQAQLFAKADERAQEQIKQARAQWRIEAEMALSKAQEAWQADVARRLAAAEAKGREQSAQALAAATARSEQAEAALAAVRSQPQAAPMRNPGDDAALRRLRDDFAAMQAVLAEREVELMETRQALAQAQAERPVQTIEAELAMARTEWEAELGQRLATAGAQAAAELDKQRAVWQAAQEQLFAKADERAQEQIKQARAQWHVEAEMALSKAQAAWQANMAAQLAAAEAKGRAQSAQALIEAAARSEQAEAALAAAQAVTQPARDPGDDVALEQLREEVAALRATLAEREAELAEERSARETSAPEAEAAARKAEEAQRLLAAHAKGKKEVRAGNNTRGAFGAAFNRSRQALAMRYLIRGGAVAASLIVAMLIYPLAEAMIVDGAWPRVTAATSAIGPMIREALGPSQAPAPEPPQIAARQEAPVPERRTIISVPIANVRAGPSPAAPVITTLSRDIDVTPVERRGSWVLIRFGGESGMSHRQEGWVFGSYVKETIGP